MVNSGLLCYAKITTNFSLPAEKPHCRTIHTPCDRGFEVKNYIALTVKVCIVLFKAVSKLIVVAFSQNGQVHG